MAPSGGAYAFDGGMQFGIIEFKGVV